MASRRGKRMRAACIPVAYPDRVYDISGSLNEFMEIIMQHAFEYKNYELAALLSQICTIGKALFYSTIETWRSNCARTDLEKQHRAFCLSSLFDRCFCCGREAKHTDSIELVFRQNRWPVWRVQMRCVSEAARYVKLKDGSRRAVGGAVLYSGNQYVFTSYTMTANIGVTLQLTKVNVHYVTTDVAFREFRSSAPEVLEITLCFLVPSSVINENIHSTWKERPISALGSSWMKSPNRTVERFNLQIVLRKMANNRYQLTQFVDFLTMFGYWLDAKRLLPQFEKNRRKNMAIRHPTRVCVHNYADTKFLVRCTHCGWTRRKGTVVFGGWKNRANGSNGSNG